MRLLFTSEAKSVLAALEASPQYAQKAQKVKRALARIEQDPKYPGLNSHKYQSMKGIDGRDLWESYVENQTPSAWRIFWEYGAEKDTIVVLTIGPHPD
jgi:hypothetical protein